MKSLKKQKRRRRTGTLPKARPARWEFNVFVCKRTSPHVFRVCIHNDRPAMLAWRKLGPDAKCEAFYSSHKSDTIATVDADGDLTYEMESPCLGTFHFYPGSLTHAVIAHEVFHAVMNWATREGAVPQKGRKQDSEGRDDNEEICAALCGSLVAQFTTKLPTLEGLHWQKRKPAETTYWK